MWPGFIEWLSEPWWQGVAGILQILAAAASVVTILLAYKTIKQGEEARKSAEQERREAVRPHFAVTGTLRAYERGDDDKIQNVILKNVGAGPAQNSEAFFHAVEGQEASVVNCSGHMGNGRLIPIDEMLTVTIQWDEDEAFEGTLKLRYLARFGPCM